MVAPDKVRLSEAQYLYFNTAPGRGLIHSQALMMEILVPRELGRCMRSRVVTRGLRVLAMVEVGRHRGRRKGNAILPLSGPVDKTQCANMTVEDSGDPIVECLQLDNILVISVQANNFVCIY